MPYIGNTIRAADDYRLIDDISSGFNGSTTSFALQVAGSAPVPFPKSPQQVLISVNGVIQEPDPTGSSGFNLVGTNIVFSSAPTNGHAFFGIIYATADYLNAGGNFPAGSLGAPSITFIGDENTGLFRKSGGSVGFVSDATEIANFDSNGITISSGNLIIPGDIIHSGDTDTKIRFPSANKVSVETAGTEKLAILHDEIIINETGGDFDLRIEGDAATNLIKIDAGNDKVGINTSAPEEKLHVGGAIITTGSNQTASTSGSNRAILDFTSGGARIGHFRGTTSAGSGSVKFFVDSSEKMQIDENGKVGIGTTSPSSILHLSRSSTTAYSPTSTTNDSTFLIVNAGAAGHATMQLQTVSGGTANTGQATISALCETNSSKSTSLTFGTRDNSGGAPSEKLRINSVGRIGIGVTDPQRTIDAHVGDSGANYIHLTNTGTGAGDTNGTFIGLDAAEGALIWNQESTYIRFGTSDTERVRIDSSGNVAIGLTSPTARFHTSAPYNVTGAKITGGASGYSNALEVSNAGGTNLLTVKGDGDVGIGTTSPSKKLEVSGGIFANGGTLQASLQGDTLNQLNPALVLTSSSNTNMRANFLLQDDFPSGRGSLAINTTESGVTNDRDLLLQRSGGRVAIGGGAPAVGFHYFGSEFRHENASVPFIRLKSTNTQGSDHGDYGRLLNDVAGSVTGLLDWKRQDSTDDSYFTIFNKASSLTLQERLRITSDGALCIHAGQQTNLNNMNKDSISMPKFFENNTNQDSGLVGANMHFQTIVRGTSGTDDTLFTFSGGGNCGFFCELTAYFSSAVSSFQGRQRMYWRAIRTGHANFTIHTHGPYDKTGPETGSYFTPSFTSSGSGSNQVLGVRVQSTGMGAYVRFWFQARIIAHDNIVSMTINR